ncbi:MAG TPA: hypothetical protein VM166_15120 [Gemmatimonadaceae bacterium]|nr:hypothetical protein [Gemmatimonadaceae bacterium]
MIGKRQRSRLSGIALTLGCLASGDCHAQASGPFTGILAAVPSTGGICSKGKVIDSPRLGRLTGVSLDLGQPLTSSRLISAYQDSTGRIVLYSEVISTFVSPKVNLESLAAEILPNNVVKGVIGESILSLGTQPGRAQVDRGTPTRGLTGEEAETVKTNSKAVMRRCTSAT